MGAQAVQKNDFEYSLALLNFFRDRVFYHFSLRGKAKRKARTWIQKDPQVIRRLPAESQNHKRKARILEGGTSTTNANRLCLPKKIQPCDGRQEMVGEAMVAKHPQVERASICKRPASRREELSNSIHPQATR
jgi:hypothetical protein